MNMKSAPTDVPSDVPAEVSGHRRRRHWVAVVVLGLAVAGGAAWYAGSRSTDTAKTADSRNAYGQGGDNDPLLRTTPVVAAPVRRGNFDIYLSALGTVTPLNTVRVLSRVDGQLLSIAFKEGQMVKAGDALALIDPRPFEVQLSLATGQLARDQALLDSAQNDLERYLTLLAQDSISRQQVDAQQSLVRQYEAAVQIARGEIENAQLQLAYTRVTAPISGRVGLRQVGPGSVVRASDASGIVVITQLQPISVVFPIPEDDLPRVMKRLRTGDRIRVDAYDRAQQKMLGGGRLLAADNQIDPTTGTIKLKAEFRNTDGALFANQFVNVKMLVETLPDVMLVPTAAIQRGAAGTFLYTIKDDGTVAVTTVKIVSTQGETAAIEAAVSVGARVVVDGADNLREGAKVEHVMRDTPPTSMIDTERRAPRSDGKSDQSKPQGRGASGGA